MRSALTIRVVNRWVYQGIGHCGWCLLSGGKDGSPVHLHHVWCGVVASLNGDQSAELWGGVEFGLGKELQNLQTTVPQHDVRVLASACTD